MKVQRLNEYYKEEETYRIDEGIFNIKPPTYKERVISCLIHLMMEEQQVSEKDFKRTDSLIDEIKNFFVDNDRVNNVIKEFEEEGRRVNYCAEFIYDAMIKNN
jgi:hypothetical protein